MLHPAIYKYRPLKDRLDDIQEQLKTKGYYTNGNSGYSAHYLNIPSTKKQIENLNLLLGRASQVTKLIKDCLHKSEIDCVNGVDEITVFFVHNGHLIRRKFATRGIYTMTWGKMIEILTEMEQVYAGP